MSGTHPPAPTAATRTMQNRCFGGHSLCWPPLAFCLHAFAPAKVTSGFYILAANAKEPEFGKKA